MICENVDFKFGLPLNISLNSLNQKKKFNRSFKLIWLLEGRITYENSNLKTESKNKINLEAGEMKIINSYTPFRILKKSRGCKFLVFDFKYNFSFDFEEKVYNLNNDANLNEFKYLAALMAKDYFYLDYQLAKKIKTKLDKLLTVLNKNHCIHNQRQDDFYNKQKDNIVIKVIEKLETQFAENLTLKEIAEEFHYNSSYLSEKFKSLTGVNFKSYLDRLRLEKILAELLYTNKNISQIALESGFKNIKSFYRVFNDQFKQSPVELKNNYPELKKENLINEFGDLKYFNDYFTEIINSYQQNKRRIEDELQKEVILDSGGENQSLNPIWNKLINAGTAQSILDSNLRKQIVELQQEINFEYLRFEGIFNDDLEVCKGDSLENIHYNWKLVDNIFDFILKNKFKPFITLSFMPELLASDRDKTIFYYQANFSPPKDINAWLDLIDAFIIHLINRYGIEEVQQWYFQVWTEFPVRGFHWAGTEAEYFNFYARTAEKIKAISQLLKVGPASETFFEENFLSEKFLEYAEQNDTAIDFYNINLYHNSVPIMEEDPDLSKFYKESTLENIKFKFKEKDYSIKISQKINNLLAKYYPKAELIATRWNVSWNAKELVHDTAFMTNFIIDNALKLQEELDGLGYLNLSDLISEWPINELPFFGGRGLMNTEGIKKSGYYAYIILSELGDEIIAQGENYIITCKGDDIQILLYNYAYLNQSYRNGDYSIIDEYNRYQVFENKDSLKFKFKFSGLKGKYKLSHYHLNRDSGSAFDQWIKMGAPSDLNNHEIKYLKNKSFPDLMIDYLDLKGEYNLEGEVERHGIEFYLLRKQFQIQL
ncbi:GH39 family glycosyl hydrolase [Halanaerobium congolense]|uniref:GH39 family glycosyl hydrolase n=1 Tax=Halanaerobium congolense TaxID=54121 RepID=UPI0010608F40|nr:helix-turn-helix domain-containing protein [Halanaerobium congolense]TDP12350.1 xylan 1,4-beta-xylosidase [Halanaerobium congolense]